MRTNILLNIIFSIFGMIGCGKTIAQEIKDAKESQEVIIRKKGDKSTKISVEINGSTVLINGKPMAEFKEDGITINNRKMIIRDGNSITMNFEGMEGMQGLENLGKMNLKNLHLDMQGIEGMENMNGMQMFNQGGAKRIVLGVMTEPSKEGLTINEVVKESAAEKAGLQKDDVINKVDDKTVTTQKELTDYLQTKKEGDKVKVYFTRNGKKQDAMITLEKKNAIKEVRVFRNNNENITEDMDMPTGGNNGQVRVYRYKNGDGSESTTTTTTDVNTKMPMVRMNRNFNFSNGPRLGLKIQDTETENGVKVIEVEKESASATAGFLKDDIITAIGDKVIKNTDEAREALNENKDKANYTVKVKRNGTEETLTVKIAKKLKVANL